MTKKVKRILSYILIFAMIFSIMPGGITAKAAENTGGEPAEQTVALPEGMDIPEEPGLYMIDWLDWPGDGVSPTIHGKDEEDGEVFYRFKGAAEDQEGNYVELEPNCCVMYLAFIDAKQNVNTIKADDENLTFTYKDGGPVTKKALELDDDKVDDNFIWFDLRKEGVATVKYTVGNQEYPLYINVNTPQAAFYSKEDCNLESYIRDEYRYLDTTPADERVFWLKLTKDVDLDTKGWTLVGYDETAKEETFSEIGNSVTIEDVSVDGSDDEIYKITVNGEDELHLRAYCKWEADLEVGEGQTEHKEDHFTVDVNTRMEYDMHGLVVYWPEWENDAPFRPQNAEPDKYPEIRKDGASMYFAFIPDEGEETSITDPNKLELTDASGVKCGKIESDIGGLIRIYGIEKKGAYKINYEKDNKVYSMNLTVRDPYIGFYTKDAISDEAYISEFKQYTAHGTNEIYMIIDPMAETWWDEANKKEKPCEITGVGIYPEGDGMTPGAIEYTKVNENTYKIAVNKDISGRFDLVGEVYFNRYDGNERRENRICLSSLANPEDEPAREWMTDGVAQAGYSGQFMTEYEFNELHGCTDNCTDPAFFVHGASVQEVINKLDAISTGEQKVYRINPGQGESAEYDKEITNTGYVRICVSQFGDRVLPTEYVSSSGYLKGIVYESTGEKYHTVPDTIDKRSKHTLVESESVPGKKEYIEDCVYWLSEAALTEFEDLKTALDTAAKNVEEMEPAEENGITKFFEPCEYLVSLYYGDVYSVIQVSTYENNSQENNGDNPLTRYYLLGDKIDGAAALKTKTAKIGQYEWAEEEQRDVIKPIELEDEEITLGRILDMTWDDRNSYIADGQGEWKDFAGTHWRSYTYPELHVNMNCDMTFIGDYKDRYIGWDSADSPYKARFLSGISREEAIKNLEGGRKVEDGCVKYNEEIFKIDDENYTDWRDWMVKYEYDASFADKGSRKITIKPDKDNAAEYNLNFFQIQSSAKTDADSTYAVGSEKVTIETKPEPNALTELTTDQKNAIEDGGELEVSIKADTIDETTADEETKKAINDIYETIDEQFDGEFATEFIDIKVNATVTKNGQKIGKDTRITDSEGLDIKVPIPEKMRGMKSYKMICAHDEDTILIIKGKLSEDKKSLSFRGKKFSVYAIAGSKSELDLSTAKWDYTSAFTYDGKEHEVKLTGLPEGVTATYTDNKKTEAGSYEAKASFTYDKTKYVAPDFSKISSLKWEIKQAASTSTTDPTTKPTTDPTTDPATKPTTDPTSNPATKPTAAPQGSTIETTDKNPVGSFKVTDTGKTDENGNVTDAEVTFTKPVESKATVTIPDTVTDANGVTYTVTEIANNAFKNDKKLTKVKIGKNIEKIGNNAFSGCKKLTTVTLGNKVESIGQNAFANCANVKKVTISKEVTTIGKGAFSGCKKLKTITITSKKLKKINKNAFKGVPANATVKLPKGLSKKQKDNYKKMIKKAGFKGKIK